jgi:hypothetical protein
MKAVPTLAILTLALATGSAFAQPTPVNPDNFTPSWTKRPPETGDSASNPSSYEQINRLTQGLDAQGRPRDKAAGKGATRPATSAEIAIGSEVRDKKKKPVGMIEMVEADGAVVATAAGKVKVPLDAFGTDGSGLIIGITKAEFDKLVATANGTPAG